ncbi:MAG: Biotin carboxyl carrier protein of acetyl-CoA carboxylase [Pyrinomonadaceae bacterium]|nr:Biotin carboxyl carrier protein of acetyl-CoA carboxylase [Pyrinomonadaceae bacterium]
MSETGSAKAEDGQVGEKKDKETRAGAEGQSFDMDELQSLAALVNEHGFTDFEFENENIRVKMSKSATVVAAPQVLAPPVQAPAATAPVASSAAETPVDEDAGLYKITSPIVGTFYRAPAPDKPPFTSEGATVSPDTVVCIVEAMKLMNEIQAETSGTIVKIYVQDGQPVEFGQPLFGVKN